MTAVSPVRRLRWRVALLAMLIFAAGIVVGAGGTISLNTRRAQQPVPQPETLPARITELLARRLDLRPDQASRVQEIIASRQERLLEIRRRVQPRVVAELNAVRDEIDAVLDTEQRGRWAKLYATVIAQWLPPPPATTRATDT